MKEWNETLQNAINQWIDNRIGDEGAMKISESLKANTALTSLDLSCDDNNKHIISEIQIQ